MPSNAPSFLIHISGWFTTRSFFSLKDRRLYTLLPMYFSFVRTSRMVARRLASVEMESLATCC